MASRQNQNKANSDGLPHFEKRDLRPPQDPSPEQILIKKLEEKLTEVKNEITVLVQRELATAPSKQIVEALSCREIDAQGNLESNADFKGRLNTEKPLLIEELRDLAKTHFENLYSDPAKTPRDDIETDIDALLREASIAIKNKSPDGPSATELDSEHLKRVFLEKINGGIDPTTNAPLYDGMIDKIVNKEVDKALVDATREHFTFLEDQTVHNKPVKGAVGLVATDKWVASVKNLPDAELQLLRESAIKLHSSPSDTTKEEGSLKAIQSEMVRKTLITGVVGIGAAAAGIALSGQIGAGSLLFTGLSFTVLAYNGVKQHFLHRDFGARMTTIWDKTLKQLHEPRNMDSAVAWSGVFFQVLRDYNPIPKILAPERTDFWRNTPDSKDEAIYNNLRSAAAYGVERMHNAHSKDPQAALVEVAMDERFGTFIKKVSAEINAYRQRWNYIPDVLNNISVGTSVTSGLLFAIDLITKFK